MLKKEIIIRTKKELYLRLFGEHTSKYGGLGVDFKEIKEYEEGDLIAHINWSKYAKSQELVVNRYDEQRQLNIVLVYLNSGSLEFGEKKRKKETAQELLVSLSYLAVSKADSLTTLFFSKECEHFLKPSKSKRVVDINYETAKKIKHLGKSIDYKKLVDFLAYKIKKRSIIFLIGDFLEAFSLSALHRHEIYALVVRDKAEEELELLGERSLTDCNSLETQKISVSSAVAKRYNDMVKREYLKLKEQNLGVEFLKIYTCDDSIKRLKELYV